MKVFKFGPNDAFLRVENPRGLSASFCARGASLYQLDLCGAPMMIAHANLEQFINDRDAYFGKLVGPIAFRVEQGRYEIQGKTYELDHNEGKNCLHSGGICYGFLDFNVQYHKRPYGVEVEYSAKAPSSSGYPAEALIQVIYTVYEFQFRIDCRIDIRLDHVVPMRVCHHGYYNLGGSPSILEHRLQMDASRVYEQDEELLMSSITRASNVLSFKEGKLIGRDLFDPSIYKTRARGYDHHYVLDKTVDTPALYLSSGLYAMWMVTDFDCIHIYTDNYSRKNNPLNNGRKENPHAGIAIEPSDMILPLSQCLYGPSRPYIRNFSLRFEQNRSE